MVKKALQIGCNYPKSRYALRGCINDVKNIRTVIKQFGYADENIVTMTDDLPKTSPLYPTRANIVKQMKLLSENAKSGDNLFVHYSGHGTQVRDKNSDEDDRNDEAICPSNPNKPNSLDDYLVDDDIYTVLVKPIENNDKIKLFCLFDACHSGTVLDLKYQLKPTTIKSNIKSIAKTSSNLFVKSSEQPNKSSEQSSNSQKQTDDFMNKYMSSSIKRHSNSLPLITQVNKSIKETEKENIKEITANTFTVFAKGKSTLSNVIMISGCRDDQTSADAYENNQYIGAMSNSFRSTITKYNKNLSYEDLLKEMHQYLKGKYTQVPQMSFGKLFDPSNKFDL